MDRKIDAATLLVTVAAVVLVVSLFLDWFGLDGSSAAANAWEVFEVLDLVLLAAAVAAVAAAFGRLDSRVLLGAALVALVVVVSQLIEPPPAGQDAEREVGVWLALAASAGLLAGAALLAAQIAVTVDVRGRERRRRVATVDKRGASPAAPGPAGDERAFAPSVGPEAPTDVAGRPAPPAAPTAPEATQPFARPPDDQAR